MKKPRLQDVADLAGVSLTTVSRYIKGELPLRPETEARVRTALDDLGYPRAAVTPHSPATTEPRTIALIVPEVESPFFGRAVDEVVRAARNYDLSVFVGSTLENPGRHAEYLDSLSQVTDAVISTGYLSSDEPLRRTVTGGVPVVLFHDRVDADFPLDCVVIDDYSGAYQATSLLLSHGHERVAMVGGFANLASSSERERGWKEALVRGGLDPAAQLRIEGPFTEEFGTAALSHLFAAHDVPTAVFAASDRIALGLLAAARTQGYSVPDDLSIIGFDDIPAAEVVTPRLTTIRVPLDKMAGAAIRLLVDRLAKPESPSRVMTIPVALVEGGSVAPPKA